MDQSTPHPSDLVYLDHAKVTDPAVRARIVMERAIIRKALEDLIAADCKVRHNDGEDFTTPHIQDIELLMRELMATDEEVLRVYFKDDEGIPHTGSIVLIYGNDGWDVIADNSVCLEPWLAGASALAEQFAETA